MGGTVSNSLAQRLRTCLTASLSSVLGKRKDFKLLPIIGNGLSRLALGEAPSWDAWIRHALEMISEPRERFESLKRQGFEHPEILNYIFQKAAQDAKKKPGIEEAIWRWFGKTLYKLKPSNIHAAIALMADVHLATTNYDDLLELAAYMTHRYSPKYVLKPLNTGKNVMPEPYPPKNGNLVIWKLHGSLPIPDSNGIRHPAEFERWIKKKSFNQLIATSELYRRTALNSDVRSLQNLASHFERSDYLCVFVGASMVSAELVLLHMLYGRWGKPRNLVTLNIHRPADQPIRFRELGIQTIDLPHGLAANTGRRKLAHIILLELLLERIEISADRKTQALNFLKAAYEELDVNPVLGISLKDVSPVVCCVGPLQTSRVIGLSDPTQQEMFHGPAKATRTPGSDVAEVLISDGSMGQGGNPVLVWDAIALPAAIVAEVGDDSPGAGILDRLQALTWLDFDGVLQVLPQNNPRLSTETSPGCATESYTCVSWFGVRTGFDSFRFEAMSRHHAEEWIREFKKAYTAPIFYVTKALAKELMNYFDTARLSQMPLLVLETGGGGNMKLESRVAQHQGIVLASAKTALRWVNRQLGIPADEFGRYIQMARFIKAVRQVDKVVRDGALSKARAIVVTLGELGAMSWQRHNTSWLGPLWIFPSSLEQNAKGPEPFKDGTSLPFAEIRDALGCGDCARPGFVASLASSLGFTFASSNLPQNSLPLAVACLNWFGLQKIRFFGMESYVEFLRQHSSYFWKTWHAADQSLRDTSVSSLPPISLGEGDFETVFNCRAALSANGDLDDLLQKWLDRFEPGEDGTGINRENRSWISESARLWKKARGLRETRASN